MKVSIIPLLHSAKYIEKTIDCAESELCEYEHIVVDGGSSEEPRKSEDVSEDQSKWRNVDVRRSIRG